MVKFSKQSASSKPNSSLAVKDKGVEKRKPVVSELSMAFFSGKMPDRSTKESIKAAEDIRKLQLAAQNPGSVLTDSKVGSYITCHFVCLASISLNAYCFWQGRKVNLRKVDASKACTALSGSMPQHMISDMMQRAGLSSSSSTSSHSASSQFGGSSAANGKNPLKESAKQDIISGAEELSRNRKTFQDNAAYEDSIQDAEDALLIVQGIDPATQMNSYGNRAGGFVKRRQIAIEKRHYVASMRGIFATKYGSVFVHSDGSLTMLQQSLEIKCRCGMTHPGV